MRRLRERKDAWAAAGLALLAFIALVLLWAPGARGTTHPQGPSVASGDTTPAVSAFSARPSQGTSSERQAAVPSPSDETGDEAGSGFSEETWDSPFASFPSAEAHTRPVTTPSGTPTATTSAPDAPDDEGPSPFASAPTTPAAPGRTPGAIAMRPTATATPRPAGPGAAGSTVVPGTTPPPPGATPTPTVDVSPWGVAGLSEPLVYPNAEYVPEGTRLAVSPEFTPYLLSLVVQAGIDPTSTWLTPRDVRAYRSNDDPQLFGRFFVGKLGQGWGPWTDIGEHAHVAQRLSGGEFYVIISPFAAGDLSFVGIDYSGYLLILLGPP